VVGTVRPDEDDISTLPPGFDAETLDQAIARTTMLGRVGRYAEVAEAALFLASPSSRYITGASIPVEGGALAKMQYPDYVEAIKSADS
jgi:NAD(P)-dependent dehydrogenase (short-subunit alcohol dehydrogenase family)